MAGLARPVEDNEDSADEEDHDEEDEEVERVKLVDEEVRVACGKIKEVRHVKGENGNHLKRCFETAVAQCVSFTTACRVARLDSRG